MFLIVIVGFIARKLGFIDNNGSKFLSNLIICVAQPFLIVGSITAIPYSPENLKTGGFIMLMSLIIHAVAGAIAFLATFKMKNQDSRRITEFGLMFANNGFLGFPILRSIFGDIGVFWGAFYVIMFNIVTWTYGMFVLGKVRPEIKINPLRIFLNYGMTPCIIGVTLFLLRVSIPAPVVSVMGYIGSICTPISLLIVGGLLATVPFKQMFTKLHVYYQCLIKLMAIPLIVLVLCKLAGMDSQMVLFGTTMAALPSATNAAMFAERHSLAPDTAAHGVGMTTLLSAFTIPLVLFLVALI